MAEIKNTQVYGIDEAIYRSGYSMMDHVPDSAEFLRETSRIFTDRMVGNWSSPHLKRAIRLANSSKAGEDQFMTGIIVTFDMALSNKAWAEAERYHFLDFVSSMSTMHRISVLPIRACCNRHVTELAIRNAEELQERYNAIDAKTDPDGKKEAYLDLLYNLPSGFELMAGMVTNYRCLKNIYRQRHDHRLPDWHVVCEWMERRLPMAERLIMGKAGPD